MTLEDLLKPLKFLDEQILRQYTKLTNSWESKGRSKYTLAAAFSFGSLALFSSSSIFAPKNITINDIKSNFSDLEIGAAEYGISSFVLLLGHDIAYSIIAPYEKKFPLEFGFGVNPFSYVSAKIQRATRLFVFGLGAYAFTDFLKSFYYEDIDRPALWLSSTLVALVSSMYIKDSDPNILDKKTFWRNAYDWIRGKINVKIPQPIAVK